MDNIKINILTRTSNRPNGFKICHDSIIKQTYNNINHIVSYDNDDDLYYLNQYSDIVKVKVKTKILDDKLDNKVTNYSYFPYNLYCNELINKVEDGWIMFLDDDDMLIKNNCIEEITKNILNEDTLFIWQMRYPNGVLLPDKQSFSNKNIRLGGIGSPCFLFHEKYRTFSKWDAYKCSDFRYLEKIYNIIPNKVWIEKPYIQLNNNGGFGKKEDLKI